MMSLLLSGFISGILIGSVFPITVYVIVAFLFLCLMLWVSSLYRSDTEKIIYKKYALFTLFFVVGLSRIYVSYIYRESELKNFTNHKIFAHGIIVAEPDVREKNTQLTISVREIGGDTGTTTVRENIIVRVPLYPEFKYGDMVSLTTTLVPPENIDAGDGRQFDYVHYLEAREVWYVGQSPHMKVISHNHGNRVKSWLFALKNIFTESISRAIPPPESSLLAGLLIGSKQALGKELLAEFSRAGVSHVVVLSGYNIAIVAESIMAILVFLPATVSFGIGCVSIILFTLLAGGGASGVRAAIMVLVALCARKLGREYHVPRAFGFAVVLMLVHNPTLLVFDPSFQLSVLATIGIIFVSPYLTPYFSKVTEKFGLREIVSSTVATQITVLPFLIYTTGLLSFVSLLINILILGTIPLTMFLGFVTGVAGLFSLYLSFIPALPTYLLLWYQLTIVHIGATLPFGVVHIPVFSFWILIVVYVILFIGLFLLKNKTAR